jgi:hypothetical protein
MKSKPVLVLSAGIATLGFLSVSFAAQQEQASSQNSQGKLSANQRAAMAKKSTEKTVETKTIYRQVMKDGSVLFTDVGSQAGVKTAAIPYQSTSNASALAVAQQQKDHWRRQSDGFERRQEQRDQDFERARRDRIYQQQMAQARDYGWYGPAPRVFYGVGGQPVHGNFPSQGMSGVGASHNVPSSFIGSGFATASPLAPNFGAGRR